MTLDGSGNYSGAERRKVWSSMRQYKLIEESRQRQEVARENSRQFQDCNFPNPVAPVSDIDRIDTENDLNAISQPLPLRFWMVDGLPIDEASTWRLPIIPFPSTSRDEKPQV